MKYSVHYSFKTELQSARKTVKDFEWCKKNGYKVKLPKGINERSPRSALYSAVKKDFLSNRIKINKIKVKVKALLIEHKSEIDNFFSNFGYRVPSLVNIYFTNYGTGGSYVLPNKVIVFFKDSAGWVVRMVIHETIHLIIEEPFIKKYKLNHWEKEAVVDAFFSSFLLKNISQEYFFQPQTRNVRLRYLNKLKFKKRASLVKRGSRRQC